MKLYRTVEDINNIKIDTNNNIIYNTINYNKNYNIIVDIEYILNKILIDNTIKNVLILTDNIEDIKLIEAFFRDKIKIYINDCDEKENYDIIISQLLNYKKQDDIIKKLNYKYLFISIFKENINKYNGIHVIIPFNNTNILCKLDVIKNHKNIDNNKIIKNLELHNSQLKNMHFNFRYSIKIKYMQNYDYVTLYYILYKYLKHYKKFLYPDNLTLELLNYYIEYFDQNND